MKMLCFPEGWIDFNNVDVIEKNEYQIRNDSGEMETRIRYVFQTKNRNFLNVEVENDEEFHNMMMNLL